MSAGVPDTGTETVRSRGSRARRALFFIGGYADDPDLEEPVEVGDDDYFFAHREVALCGWCKLPPHDAPFGSEAELQQALRAAAERSTRWGWRWRPTWE